MVLLVSGVAVFCTVQKHGHIDAYHGHLTCIVDRFGDDLYHFIVEHDGRLPRDWREFEIWETERDGETEWTAVESEKRALISSSPYAKIGGVDLRLEIIHADLMPFATQLNYTIASALEETVRRRSQQDAAALPSEGVPSDGR